MLIQPERADAHDEEAPARQHRHRRQRAPPPPRCVADAQAREREIRRCLGPLQLGKKCGRERHRSPQQQRPRPEENPRRRRILFSPSRADKRKCREQADRADNEPAHAFHWSRRERLLSAPREQFPRRTLRLFAQRQPQREHRHQHAAQDAARQRGRLGVEVQVARAHGVAPDGGERVEHRARIPDAARRAEQRPEQRKPRALQQEQPPHLLGRETQRQQRAHLRRALLDAELKQQRHQHARRDDEEEAEPDEQPAEVLPLAARLERLLAHGLEDEAEVGGLELREKGLLNC